MDREEHWNDKMSYETAYFGEALSETVLTIFNVYTNMSRYDDENHNYSSKNVYAFRVRYKYPHDNNDSVCMYNTIGMLNNEPDYEMIRNDVYEEIKNDCPNVNKRELSKQIVKMGLRKTVLNEDVFNVIASYL